MCNTTRHDEDDLIHDEDDSSEDEHVTEIELHTVNEEQSNGEENKFLTTNLFLKWKTKNRRAHILFI